MGSAAMCPFGPEEHARSPAHKHPYQPQGDMPKQCTCGSRQWLASVTPGIPVSIICARPGCGRVSRIATAYERGRDAGPRVRGNAGTAPPF